LKIILYKKILKNAKMAGNIIMFWQAFQKENEGKQITHNATLLFFK